MDNLNFDKSVFIMGIIAPSFLILAAAFKKRSLTFGLIAGALATATLCPMLIFGFVLSESPTQFCQASNVIEDGGSKVLAYCWSGGVLAPDTIDIVQEQRICSWLIFRAKLASREYYGHVSISKGPDGQIVCYLPGETIKLRI